MKMKIGKYSASVLVIVAVTGCSGAPQPHLDGETLLKTKCAGCHNLDMPPKTYKDEKAPPMMAVAFHVKDFMKVDSPSDKKPKFIDFFKDYVLHPDAKKSFCDKESLASYGLMPSQEGKVTEAEVGAIAEYVFDHYDQNAFMKLMKEQARFDALPKGEQIATKNGCLTCHGKTKRKAAPAFTAIAKKSPAEIKKVILNGSKGRWKGFERMTMPAFKGRISEARIDTLIDWMQHGLHVSH